MRIDAGARRVSSCGRWLGACALLVAVLSGGCRKSEPGADVAGAPKFEVADDEPAGPVREGPRTDGIESIAGRPGAGVPAGTSPRQPPPKPVVDLDKITIPDGTGEELLAFIDRLGQIGWAAELQAGPQGVPPEVLQPLYEAMIEAADRILASDAETAVRKTAIDYKGGALGKLSQLVPDRPWDEEVRAFAASLAAEQDPVIALEGKCILFGILVGEIAMGRSKDVPEMMTQLRSLLADDVRSDSVLDVSQQAVVALRNIGRDDEAREAYELIANAFEAHDDPALAQESANMQERLRFYDSKFELQLNAVLLQREGAVEEFTPNLTELLGNPQRGFFTLQETVRAAGNLEQTGQYALAIRVWELIREAFREHADPELRDVAQQIVELSLRRLNLIGKPLALQGTTLEGAAFDTSQYQGKVVLIVGWDPSPPSLEELKNIKSRHETYHSQGFEVVGVFWGEDPSTATQFVQDLQLPWITIHNNELFEELGVEILPFLILVDREGVAVDFHVRGPALDERLPELLGSVASPPNS